MISFFRDTATIPSKPTASLKMKIGIARAQIVARGGNQDEAVNSLVRIQNEARNAGLLGREFEARLALGRLQLQLGKKKRRPRYTGSVGA